MLEKSLILLMLLLGTASLIGINTAVYHQPEVATAQPQPQPQQQQQQLQSPSNSPPILGKRPLPQDLQKQQSNVGTIVQMAQDKELVNRLFPYIIQKIDGKTLAQKIDGGLLAQKVFPYLDIISTVTIRYGPNQEVVSTARCLPGEKVLGGGYQYGGPTEAIVHKTYPISDNQGLGWLSTYNAGQIDNAKIISYVTCLSERIALKGVQEPSNPPPVLR
jgi:hypothetical protein